MVILTMCLYDLLKDDPAEYISQRQIAEAQLKHFLGRQITAEAGNFLQQTGVVQLMGPEEVGRLMQDLGVPLTRRRGANGYKTEAIREALNRLKPGILKGTQPLDAAMIRTCTWTGRRTAPLSSRRFANRYGLPANWRCPSSSTAASRTRT